MREARIVVSLGGERVEIGRMHGGDSWFGAGSGPFFKVSAGYTGVLTL